MSLGYTHAGNGEYRRGILWQIDQSYISPYFSSFGETVSCGPSGLCNYAVRVWTPSPLWLYNGSFGRPLSDQLPTTSFLFNPRLQLGRGGGEGPPGFFLAAMKTFTPITLDRVELQPYARCHCICLIMLHRVICTVTYLRHDLDKMKIFKLTFRGQIVHFWTCISKRGICFILMHSHIFQCPVYSTVDRNWVNIFRKNGVYVFSL